MVYKAETSLIKEDVDPDDIIQRCVICVWLLFAFLITSGYGGNLRAFLMNPILEPPINTLDDMLSSGYPWEQVSYIL